MKEHELKNIEIIFDKSKPQSVDTKIKITAKIDSESKLEYKFITGKGGIWTAIKDYSEDNECVWEPKAEGKYTIMVQARNINRTRSLDYLAKEEYSIVKGEVMDFMRNNQDKDKTIQDVENKIENSETNKEFKEYISSSKNADADHEDLLLLMASEVTPDEKSELVKEIKTAEEEAAVSMDMQAIEYDEATLEENCKPKEVKGDINLKNEKSNVIELKHSKSKESSNEIIEKVSIDQEEIIVGNKFNISVKTFNSGDYLYKFYIKRFNEWNIIKDYESNNVLSYTANECGESEFLIQCKRIDSKDSFDDYKTISVNIKELDKIEITNIECSNDKIIVGEELNFEVSTDIENNNENKSLVVLYKFYKIAKDGKSVCLQDYSTNNKLTYTEDKAGEYRLLCFVKSMLSNKEYDDRAMLVYNVKPYRDIKINSFVASLNSPQASETNIKFTSEIEGGSKLLYRYRVEGPTEEDTGYGNLKEFEWKPMQEGEYSITLFVKNEDFKGEYEDTKKIAFTIEKRGQKPIRILDVVVDKPRKNVVGKEINIMVNAEGATSLLYSFIVTKGNRKIEEFKYSPSNWLKYIPKEVGEYVIQILIKDKYSEKESDISTSIYLKVLEYLPGEIDYIIVPYNANYLVGDTIELECIIQNTQDVLVKYETKINGHSIEETEFSKEKKLKFVPKVKGKYTIEVFAKNVKSKYINDNKKYDSKKQINFYVNDASPIINTKIIASNPEPVVNQAFTIEAQSTGGKDVCYEFYLMEDNNWTKVQSYSKKKFYGFIPFKAGKYKVLALAKSYYKKVNYEDYAELSFTVKEEENCNENNSR